MSGDARVSRERCKRLWYTRPDCGNPSLIERSSRGGVPANDTFHMHGSYERPLNTSTHPPTIVTFGFPRMATSCSLRLVVAGHRRSNRSAHPSSPAHEFLLPSPVLPRVHGCASLPDIIYRCRGREDLLATWSILRAGFPRPRLRERSIFRPSWMQGCDTPRGRPGRAYL